MPILAYTPLQHYLASRGTMVRLGRVRTLSSRVRPHDPIPALKNQMAQIVVDRLDGWSQANAAALLDTNQPRISDLRNGRLKPFSLEQLIRFTSRLGGEIQVTVTWSPRKRWIAARWRPWHL